VLQPPQPESFGVFFLEFLNIYAPMPNHPGPILSTPGVKVKGSDWVRNISVKYETVTLTAAAFQGKDAVFLCGNN
jgi:hypothetical protein